MSPAENPQFKEDITADSEPAKQETPKPAKVIVREVIETLLLTLYIFLIVNTVTGRYRVEGHSMSPTLHDGDYLIVNKLSYVLDEPQRGDIIVLHDPQGRNREYIKRVIGLPGDHIEISGHIVSLNGAALDEPYINGTAFYRHRAWTVPDGHYFVLGDNRNNSSDSREWSFLPRDDIVGRAWLIYWDIENWGFVPHHHLDAG